MSDAFHIGVPLEGDPEFIEIPSTDGMESMLMIDTEASVIKRQLDERTKENEELRAVVQSLKKTLSSKEEEKVGVDNLLAEALGDKRDLGSRLEKSEQIIAQLREESLDKDVQIEALQREFDEFSEKYKKELEGVQRERESVQAENAVLQLQLTSASEQQEVEVGQLQSELTALRLQMTDQKTQFEEMCGHLTSHNELAEKLRQKEQTCEQLSAEKAACEMKLTEMREQLREFAEQLSTKEASIMRLNEELANAQTNVAELVGAAPDDRPTVHSAEGVDPEAHEALRRAFEKLQADNASLNSELRGCLPELERMRQREVELTRKLELGKEEYTKKATEANDLSRQLRKVQESMVVVSSGREVEELTKQLTASQSREARLAAQLEDLSSTQELAVQELTQRKEEGKEKDVRIAELEEALQRATEEHRRMEAEIMVIEERTDRKIHDKNGEITLLQDRIAELEEDVEQERREVVNLREGLRLRQESLDVQQQQQQRQRAPQYQVPYQPPQPSAPYVQPYAPPPIRYPAQGYPHNQGPAPTPHQPSAPPAHVPAPVPPPGPNEGQCPICHLNFPKNSLEQHVNGHFEN